MLKMATIVTLPPLAETVGALGTVLLLTLLPVSQICSKCGWVALYQRTSANPLPVLQCCSGAAKQTREAEKYQKGQSTRNKKVVILVNTFFST